MGGVKRAVMDTFREIYDYYYRDVRKMLEERDIDFKRAGIVEPERFVMKVAYAVDAFFTLLAIATMVLLYSMEVEVVVELPEELVNPVTSSVYYLFRTLYPFLAIPTFVFLSKVVRRALISFSITSKISSNREDVERHMHSAVVAMLGLAKAKVGILEIIKEIANMGFGYLSKIFAEIYYDMTISGKSFREALAKAAAKSPSPALSDFLRGFASIAEAGGNLDRYLEDRLNTYDVERKLNLQAYLSKLEMASELFLLMTVVVPIMLIVIGMSLSLMGKGSPVIVYVAIYVMIPLGVVAMLLVVFGFSPEGGSEKKGEKYIVVPLVIAVVNGIIAYLIGINWELATVFSGGFSAVIVGAYLMKFAGEDERISVQLPTYLNKVLALLEANKDFATAFTYAAINEPDPLGKYVKGFAKSVHIGYAKTKAFEWLTNATTSKDLKLVATILSKVSVVNGRVRETILGLLGEMTRTVNFNKERWSKLSSVAMVLFVSYGVYVYITYTISSGILTMFRQMQVSGSVAVGSMKFNYQVVDTAKMLLRHGLYLVGVSSAIGFGAIKGDLRRAVLPAGVLLVLSGVLAMLLLS